MATKHPLKADPTRTGGIRRRFMAETKRRFSALKKDVVKFIATEDAYGLGIPSLPELKLNSVHLVGNAREYAFLTDAGKVQHFRDWLQSQIDARVLSVSEDGEPWTATYVDSAYRQGAVRAFTDARRVGMSETLDFYEGTRAQFLRDSFAAPETISKLELLATRSFENMRGVTGLVNQQLGTILADGIAHGRSPRTIARDMSKRIDNITRVRALTVARTETIHAHAEGQLDSFERLGVDELGVEVEWSTAGDSRVCSQCAGLDGTVRTVEESRGLIPVHPNCRCAWIPKLN